jgi:hypothetical protein
MSPGHEPIALKIVEPVRVEATGHDRVIDVRGVVAVEQFRDLLR